MMRRKTFFARTAIALIALVTPLAVTAQEADLAALLSEADRNNPEILAARNNAEAAEARIPQAAALPDPVLGVGIMSVPVAQPSFGRDRMTMTQIRVSEAFPWPEKLGLREDVARLRAGAARWEVERVRRKVVAEVKAAYYQIYFLDRALDVTDRNEGLLDDFARLTSTKYGVGGGAQPDVLKAQVEQTRLADQLVALRERRAGAIARLNALLARPTDSPLPATELPDEVRGAALEEAGDDLRFASSSLADVLSDAGISPSDRNGGQQTAIPSARELQRLALENNPMIQAHVQRVAAQNRAVALAGKAKLPDFNVSVGYSRRAGYEDFVDFMVSVPLPVFSGRKQDQAVVEEAAVLVEHEARRHAMVNETDGEIEALVADLRRAREQLVLLNDGILPQARTSLSSATTSYQVGNVDFLTLLDAQVTLYRHELDYHRHLADFAENLAKLERAVGTEVLR